jgi:hypothetical protein
MNNDNNNFMFMKSGRLVTDVQEQIEERDLLSNIWGLVLLFIKNSIKTATTYINHKNRTVITLDDITRSMKLETIIFFTRENTRENAIEMSNLVRNVNSDNNTIENVISEIFSIVNDDEIIIELQQQINCECILCSKIDNIENEWNSFEPANMLQKIIKKQINKMTNMFESL